jgi:hypothetical protein
MRNLQVGVVLGSRGSFRGRAGLVEQTADGVEVFGGSAAGRERLRHESHGRAAERPVQQFAEKQALRVLLPQSRLLHVPALIAAAGAAGDEILLHHDLKELQPAGAVR